MRVVMLGPNLERRGGIASLARTLLDSRALAEVDIRYVGTVGNGSLLRRLGQMALGEARFVADLARHGPPDLYHLFVSDGLSFYRKLAYFAQARLTGRPVVLHGHFTRLERIVTRSRLHASLARWLFSSSAQVQVVSHDMADRVTQWSTGRAEVRLLHNGVSLVEFTFSSRRRDGGPVTVLFMGQVGERKGAFDLVAAVPRVLEAVPGARFRIGGDGELEGLRAEAARLRIAPSLDVMGWIEGAARRAAFAAADVFCLPSHAEGLPMAILEAMAQGLPVVASRVNGIPDAVVEGETGYLVAPGDGEALAERLVRLLRCAELRARMGQAGRSRVEQLFDGEKVALRLVEYWREVLEQR